MTETRPRFWIAIVVVLAIAGIYVHLRNQSAKPGAHVYDATYVPQGALE